MAPAGSAQSAFTPAQSLVRLRRLQALVAAEQLDALLFVAGVDGRDHRGATHALNYLFAGAPALRRSCARPPRARSHHTCTSI